jgi:hypothetical protein
MLISKLRLFCGVCQTPHAAQSARRQFNTVLQRTSLGPMIVQGVIAMRKSPAEAGLSLR